VDLRFTTKGQCRFFLVKKITIPLRVILVPQSATATCHDQIKIGFKPGLNRYFANTQKRLKKTPLRLPIESELTQNRSPGASHHV
jgi:hypothetical protein